MKIIIKPEYTVPDVIADISLPVRYRFTDDPVNKSLVVTLRDAELTFVLWHGEAYEQAGNYSQAALDKAVTNYVSGLQP